MKKTLLAALIACLSLSNCSNKTDNKISTHSDILGQWSIIEANGQSTDSAETTPFILFADSGVVSGHASVNAFFGQYTIKGDSIFFEYMGSTSMLGHDMEIEMAIMTAIGQWSTFELTDSILKAKDLDGKVVMSMQRN